MGVSGPDNAGNERYGQFLLRLVAVEVPTRAANILKARILRPGYHRRQDAVADG
jgi:hypothetical protein